MNILYRNIPSFLINVRDFKSRLLVYQDYYYDNIYFVDYEGRFEGYTNLSQEIKHLSSDILQERLSPESQINEIDAWFKNHPGCFRVPVVENKLLIGEYYDADSNGICLYKQIEDKALEVAHCFKSEFVAWCKNRNIGIIGTEEQYCTLCKLYDKFVHIDAYNDKYDAIIDLELTPNFRELLSLYDNRVISLSEILIPIMIERLSRFYKQNGVHFIAVDGLRKSEIPNNISNNINKSIEEVLQDKECIKIFCNDDYESLKLLSKHQYDLNQISKIISNGIHNILVDTNEGNLNIVDGKRITINTPAEYTNKVHVFGPCIVQGLCVCDANTIPSLIQDKLIQNNHIHISVENHGLSYGKDLLNDLLYMMATSVSKGDIIIWLSGFTDEEENLLKKYNIPIVDVKEKLSDLSNWFLNNPFHCNTKANRVYANCIYDSIAQIIDKGDSSNKCSFIEMEHLPLKIDSDAIFKSEELHRYLTDLKKYKFTQSNLKKGCVVINANPCTNGHLYLIKEALRKVDLLYVILVEESRNGFSYLDREYMLKENFKDDSRVCLISGGSIFTSTKCFPEYFNRSARHAKIDPTLNHKIFALKIAPLLDISVRFFGSEQEDEVTRIFNSTALEYLPTKGIDVVIIPRLTINNICVSAKSVRTLYYQKNYSEMSKFVPFSTYKRLLELHGESSLNIMDIYLKTSTCCDSIGYPQLCNNTSYPGMCPKFGVELYGEKYMLKIANDDYERLSLFSEKIGTAICKQLNIPSSDISIVNYGGSLALLSKDWLKTPCEHFFPLASYFEELIDVYQQDITFSYDLFVSILRDKCPNSINYILDIFWKISIVDYFLCNTRSAGNIGFIHNKDIRLSPIYDNSTLLKNIDDKHYCDMDFPILFMKFNGEETSGYQVLSNFENQHKEEALNYVRNNINIKEITKNTIYPEEEFLCNVIQYRFHKLFDK